MPQSLQWRIALNAVVLAVSLFLIYPSIGPVPSWWAKYLPNNPIRLGLDLQGGLHLVLEVQADKAVETKVDQAVSEALAAMKDALIKYNDAQRTSGTSLTVYLKDSAQEALFDQKVVARLSSFRKASAVQGDKGYEVRLELDPREVETSKERAVRQAVDTIRNRVDAFGVVEPDVVIHGTDRIVVQLPGLREDLEQAKRIIRQTARLEFKLLDEEGRVDAALKGNLPPDREILEKWERNPNTGAVTKTPYLIKKRTELTGDHLVDAKPIADNVGRILVVSLSFDSLGAKQFADLTRLHIGERLAIILDGRVFSAPVIRSEISGGEAIIEGLSSPEEATELSKVLRAGSLPAPVKILEERSIGPSLGEDSIRMGRNAILLGVILIALGMVVYYKWSGAVADVALVLNPLLLLAVMVSPGLRATLTLPGLAGVALTMGMAIDANILIFERVREELRMGKSARAALENGYDKAFLTIIDTHLTNILAALPLIQFGTGPVKGFAVTLCIGLIISLFTAYFVTRTIFDYAFLVKRFKTISI